MFRGKKSPKGPKNILVSEVTRESVMNSLDIPTIRALVLLQALGILNCFFDPYRLSRRNALNPAEAGLVRVPILTLNSILVLDVRIRTRARLPQSRRSKVRHHRR